MSYVFCEALKRGLRRLVLVWMTGVMASFALQIALEGTRSFICCFCGVLEGDSRCVFCCFCGVLEGDSRCIYLLALRSALEETRICICWFGFFGVVALN
jgi:hypothetical protein